MNGLEEVRSEFAREVSRGFETPRLAQALERVAREEFLPPGPWLTLPDEAGYRSTPDADPRHVYADVAIAIDPTRILNSGAPRFVASAIDMLALREGDRVAHIGCATGYYTALIAEVVGPSGAVFACELDPELAARAERLLRRWRQVEVRHADGLGQPEVPVHAIFVDGGVTHPQPRWLDAVPVGGRLAMPLTAMRPPSRIRRILRDNGGRMLYLQREREGWAARFGPICGIQPLLGGRRPDVQERLRVAYERGDSGSVRSLRRDPHDAAADCWLHEAGFCLSRREPGS
jgi:protein-L-isoaspartate(D-aspartate) O-methyltransferase